MMDLQNAELIRGLTCFMLTSYLDESVKETIRHCFGDCVALLTASFEHIQASKRRLEDCETANNPTS
jgi:hypothetical protein